MSNDIKSQEICWTRNDMRSLFDWQRKTEPKQHTFITGDIL